MPMDTAWLSTPDFPLSILSSRSHSLYSTREPVPGTPSYNLIPTPSNSLLMLKHAGLSVALAPEVAAEFAEHAHDLAQGEGLGGRRQCLGHAQMQHLDFHHREDFGGRQVRLRASQERHMHQAYPDDAKEGQITLQALGLLEHAVLDLAARFEHLVPDLDAPALPVPAHLLGGGLEVFDTQVRQQYPTDRLAAGRRRLLGRADEGDSHRLARARRLGVCSAAPRRLDRDFGDAHLDARRTCFAPPVARHRYRAGAARWCDGQCLEHAGAALAVFWHEFAIGACADQILRAQLLRLRQELEEVRLPIRYRDDRHARGGALDRLVQRNEPLRALLLLD